MDHKEHQKRIRLIAIISTILFLIGLLSVVVTITQFYSFGSVLELVIGSVIIIFFIVCASSFDIILYKKADDIDNTWSISLWQLVSKFKMILTVFVVVVLITFSSFHLDGMLCSYVRSFFGIILLCIIGVVQVKLSCHLETVERDCIHFCRTIFVVYNNSYNLSCTQDPAYFGDDSKFT